MSRRVYTTAKAGMNDADRDKILAVVEKSTTSDYREHLEDKQANYERRVGVLKSEIDRMSQQDWIDATSGVGCLNKVIYF